MRGIEKGGGPYRVPPCVRLVDDVHHIPTASHLKNGIDRCQGTGTGIGIMTGVGGKMRNHCRPQVFNQNSQICVVKFVLFMSGALVFMTYSSCNI